MVVEGEISLLLKKSLNYKTFERSVTMWIRRISPSAAVFKGFVPRSKPLPVYNQLSPRGHLAITDTPLIRTAAKFPANITDI